MIDQGNTCGFGCDATNQQRSRSMRVDQLVVFIADQLRDLTVAEHVHLVAHLQFVQWNVRTANIGKPISLHASESYLETEFRQRHRQKVLYPFGTSEMFPVDKVEDTSCFCACPV